jgi:hypothetical protein
MDGEGRQTMMVSIAASGGGEEGARAGACRFRNPS